MSEVLSTCGACGQRDDHPKHQISVGVALSVPDLRRPAIRQYHEHDFDRNGTISYHFDCESDWHDLHSVLAVDPFDSPDPERPWLAWLAEQAAEHRKVADTHAAIIEACKGGKKGDELREWISRLNIRGGAGGLDQTMCNAGLDALAPNSGTTTFGTKTITGPISMRLMTANGSDTAAGTELATSGGYTAGGSAIAFAAAATGSKATNAGVSWTNMPATTLTGPEEWDASATKQRTFWGPWSGGNISVASGNTFTVASGNLTNTLA